MKAMKIPQFKQDTDYTCGPTALQMAFAFFHVRLSEKRLRFEAHTRKRDGTRHRGMIESARHHGFYVYVNDDASLAEVEYLLAAKRPVIVHFIDPTGDGHYTLIHKVDGKVHFSDPWFGKRFALPRAAFLKRWTSEDGKHRRWLMAIGREPFTLGREYAPS